MGAFRVPLLRAELFIGNQWVHTAEQLPVENPSTGEVFAHVAAAGPAEVDAAVAAARACFRSELWGPKSTPTQRGAIVRKMGAALADARDDFARLESMDCGKPLTEAEADIDACIEVFKYYADLAETLGDKAVKSSDPDLEVFLRREPFGVIGAVTPWNFPLFQSVMKVAPALAAGCTMVLKPSELAPATSLRLGDLALAAGLPRGALNVLSGTGASAGAPLLEHKGVDRLSFTGSSRTGRLVLHAAARRLLPSSVELGGKSAMIVFDDVDIEPTVDWIMCGIFMCAGQVCSATSRLLVQETIYEPLMRRLTEETRKLRVGDPFDKDTNVGPLISQDQLDKVVGFVERALAGGARAVTGGARLERPGFFFQPTILEGLTDEDEAWREEIFGPVLAVRHFRTEEEAVRLANDTPYGLAAAVCSRDASRGARVAARLDAGMVWQNCSNAIPTEAPFGGFKMSGFGKEGGELGIEDYFRIKTVVKCEPTHSWHWFVEKSRL